MRGRRHTPRNTRMPNYFYDLPEELQEMIYIEVYKGVPTIAQLRCAILTYVKVANKGTRASMERVCNDAGNRGAALAKFGPRMGGRDRSQFANKIDHYVHQIPCIDHTRTQLAWSARENGIWDPSWAKIKKKEMVNRLLKV